MKEFKHKTREKAFKEWFKESCEDLFTEKCDWRDPNDCYTSFDDEKFEEFYEKLKPHLKI